MRLRLGINVLDAALERLEALYRAGHRIVVSFSGGKDSTVCLELCVMAARRAGRLPVEVVTRDEEVAYPDTFEFIERVGNRPDVKMTWLCQQQPMLNIFNRAAPYFWALDPLLRPDQWMRQPPSYAEFIEEKAIDFITTPKRFPVAATPKNAHWDSDDKTEKLIAVIGLRTEESSKRTMGLHASGGYVTGSNAQGVFNCRPIYDWREADVWKFIRDLKCDYNHAYDIMHRMGARRMRIGPPTMTVHSIEALSIASRAWPQWFDRLCKRVPGVRTAVQFGRRAVSPYRQTGESWEQAFYRECLGPDTPDWIRARSQQVLDHMMKAHVAHSVTPFPEVEQCRLCYGTIGSWKALTETMWGGDPFSLRTVGVLPYVEPEFFRQGAGTWGPVGAKIMF